jgi:flagellar biosynthetic protein FlhB
VADTTGERTEKATPKRLEDAYRDGKISTSRDLTGWISLGAAAITLPMVAGSTSDAVTAMLGNLRGVIKNPTSTLALQAVEDALGRLLPILAPMLAAAFVGALVGSIMQGGLHFKQFKPSFEHFNLVQGAGRMFGKQALWEGAKSLLKTGVLGTALWFAIQGVMPLMSDSGVLPVSSVVATASGVLSALLQAAIAAGIGLAFVDVVVVMRRNRKHTRMTRQELKDESKSTEGDPLVRQQRRSRAIAISRNRMMAAVAAADVVLLNPTHLTVALKYEPGKSAPRVVAKGAGSIAAKIRERAAENRVPMVHDIPLARALYAACDVGQEIPEELYAAVARVLAFVMSLKRRGAAMGVHSMAS